jgi:hypothetical protein
MTDCPSSQVLLSGLSFLRPLPWCPAGGPGRCGGAVADACCLRRDARDSGPVLEEGVDRSGCCAAAAGESADGGGDDEAGAEAVDGGETDGDMEGGALSEEGAEEGASFLSIGLSGSAETCAASRCEAREDGRLPPQLPPRDVSFSFFVFSPGCTCPKGAWRYFPRDAGLMYSSWWPPISLWRGGGLLSAFHPPAARLCLPASRPCWRRHFAGREDQSCLAPIFRARGDGLGGCRHGRGRAGSAIEKPNFGYTAGETLNLQ